MEYWTVYRYEDGEKTQIARVNSVKEAVDFVEEDRAFCEKYLTNTYGHEIKRTEIMDSNEKDILEMKGEKV